MRAEPDTKVLQGRRGWRRWLIALPLAAIVAAGIAFGAVLGVSSAALWLVLVVAVILRHDDIVSLTDSGLTVRKRDHEKRYATLDILEASWGTAGQLQSGPVIRTISSSGLQSPSPTFPKVVAALFLPARAQREVFAAWCEQHGIPYTPHLQRDIARGRRKARRVDDAERLERWRAGTTAAE